MGQSQVQALFCFLQLINQTVQQTTPDTDSASIEQESPSVGPELTMNPPESMKERQYPLQQYKPVDCFTYLFTFDKGK